MRITCADCTEGVMTGKTYEETLTTSNLGTHKRFGPHRSAG